MIRVFFLPQAGLQSSFLLTECFGNRPAGNPYRNPNLHRRNQVAPRPKSLHCTFSRSVSLRLPSRSWFVSLPVCCLTLLSRTLHTRTLARRKYLLLKPLPSKNNPMYEPTTDWWSITNRCPMSHDHVCLSHRALHKEGRRYLGHVTREPSRGIPKHETHLPGLDRFHPPITGLGPGTKKGHTYERQRQNREPSKGSGMREIRPDAPIPAHPL